MTAMMMADDDLYSPAEKAFLLCDPTTVKKMTQHPILTYIFPPEKPTPKVKCLNCVKLTNEKKKSEAYDAALSIQIVRAKELRAKSKKQLATLQKGAGNQIQTADILKSEIVNLNKDIDDIKRRVKEAEKRNWRKMSHIRHGLFLLSNNCLMCLCALQFHSRENLLQHIVRRVEGYKEEAVCNICSAQCATTWAGYKEHVETMHNLRVEE